jgi:hypothetical protein
MLSNEKLTWLANHLPNKLIYLYANTHEREFGEALHFFVHQAEEYLALHL